MRLQWSIDLSPHLVGPTPNNVSLSLSRQIKSLSFRETERERAQFHLE